jgi:DNA-binding NarL/FixJ family response regulator
LVEDAGFEVVGEADGGTQALALTAERHPDVVVLDISMPGESGLVVAARLRKQHPATRVLILSMHDHSEYVLEAVRAGAHGYVLKDTGPAELREAVRAVHQGSSFYSQTAAERLSAALRGEVELEQRRAALETLTGREREVLVEIADGKTNKDIGSLLGISPRTVESHRESLMRKLGIRSVAGLTRFALEAGLVRP